MGSVRYGGVGGEKTVFTSRAVLRRPIVRTGTSTTPVWMGFGRVSERGGGSKVDGNRWGERTAKAATMLRHRRQYYTGESMKTPHGASLHQIAISERNLILTRRMSSS